MLEPHVAFFLFGQEGAKLLEYCSCFEGRAGQLKLADLLLKSEIWTDIFEVNTIVLYQVFGSEKRREVKSSTLPKITQPTEADVSGLFSATVRSQPNQTTQQKHPIS